MWNFVLSMVIWFGFGSIVNIIEYSEDNSIGRLIDIILCVSITTWGYVLLSL